MTLLTSRLKLGDVNKARGVKAEARDMQDQYKTKAENAKVNGVAARKAHSLGGASSNSVLPRRALLSNRLFRPTLRC